MPQIPDRSSAQATHLSAFRGVAALVVMFSHLRNFIFVDFDSFHGVTSPLLAPFYLLAHCGHQAVIVFFVMSGYLVGGSVIDPNRQWSWKKYLIRRYTRLYVVLIPALLIGGGLDLLGNHIPRSSGLYHGMGENHMVGNYAANLNVNILLKNILFLQAHSAPVYGSNTPLWSVGYEAWYYLMFPLGFLSLSKLTKIGPRIFYVVLIAAAIWIIKTDVRWAMIIWLFGAFLYALPPIRVSGIFRKAVYFVFLVGFVGAAQVSNTSSHIGNLYLDVGLGVVTTLVFWMMLSQATYPTPALYQTLANRTADVSYTLYTTHFPLLTLMVGVVLGIGRVNPTLPSVSAALVAGIICVLWAILIWWIFERRTEQIQKFFISKLSKPIAVVRPAEVAAHTG